MNTHRLVHLVKSLGWIINLEKSDLVPTQGSEFLGYKFDLRVGLVFPIHKEIDHLLEKKNILSNVESSSHICKEAYVTDWKDGFNGEDYTIGSSAHEVTPRVSKNTQDIPSLLIFHFLCPRFTGIFSVVDQCFNFEGGFTTPSEGAQSLSIHRCFSKWLGVLT